MKEINSHQYHKNYEETKRNFIDPILTAEFSENINSTRGERTPKGKNWLKFIYLELNKREESNQSYKSSLIKVPERNSEIIPYKAPRIEESSPETTRYRPTQSSGRSQDDDNYPQYDLNDIKLPAYCNDHPESKLLYLAQIEGDEILCCVY